MKLSEEYKLSLYKDYGPLTDKAHIRLVKNTNNGKICVQKVLNAVQRDIIEFRRKDLSPYFPKLYETIEIDNKSIIIEEYVEGVTLEEYMMGEPLLETVAVKIARQICEALECLHNYNPMIIYRDLKAENIMITSEEQVKLIDFDISRKYQDGKKRDTKLLGTAEYAAPEQFGYFQTDHRTDIYAFGVLLNYMLTTKFPVEYIADGKCSKIIRKCIELEPSKRFQSAEEILEALPEIVLVNQKNGSCLEDFEENDSWTIPGFRSDCIWKKILAVFGYGMIMYIGCSMELHSRKLPYGDVVKWVNRVIFITLQLVAVAVAFNYRGIADRIRIYPRRHKMLKIITYPMTAFVFVCMTAAIIALFELILEFIF